MDYSIHDAIEAGFNEVVFIIRKDIEEEFKKVIGNRITDVCAKYNVTVDYAFQDINDIPGTLPEGRTKPWGTGQAVLAAKDIIDSPFVVINADDYYGKEAFKAVHEFLINGGKSCMAGFVLKNTLSDNGSVTRGICKMDSDNNLTEIIETKNIIKTGDGAIADSDMFKTTAISGPNPRRFAAFSKSKLQLLSKKKNREKVAKHFGIPLTSDKTHFDTRELEIQIIR